MLRVMLCDAKRQIFKQLFMEILFLEKTLGVNNICNEKVSSTKQNLLFGVDINLQVPLLTYKINAHNTSDLRS